MVELTEIERHHRAEVIPPDPGRSSMLWPAVAVIAVSAVAASLLVYGSTSREATVALLGGGMAVALLVGLLGQPGATRRRRARWNTRPGRHPFEVDI